MIESLVSNEFKYKKLTEAEQKQRGILGRLVGPIADFKNPTRNGRRYSESLWEQVFNNSIMKEKLANKCVLGELGHPADRTEIDMEKVAICMAEPPKKGRDGLLWGVFDILNTPNGKILKTLCDYGCNVAISSRGQGDLITDANGDEAVDPDTYDCETFDIVIVPGVEAARLKYVTEGLDKRQNLKMALKESLNSANEMDRKIMNETLTNLNIELNEAKDSTEEELPIEETPEESEKAEDMEEKIPEETSEVDDTEEPEEVEAEKDMEIEVEPATDAAEEVPEADEKIQKSDEEIFLDFLAQNFDEDKIKEVAKILGIEVLDDEGNPIEDASEDSEAEESEDAESTESTAGEDTEEESDEGAEKASDEDIELEDESNEDTETGDEAVDEGLKSLVSSLKEAIKAKSDLENEIKDLQEKLAASDARVSGSEQNCNKLREAVARLSAIAKSHKDLTSKTSELQESLNSKDATIKLLNEKLEAAKAKDTDIKALNESADAQRAQIKSLTEQLAESKKKTAEMETLTEKLSKQTSLKESYKKLANKAVDKYIEVRADVLGLTPQDIKRKLGESYTLEDVDAVCEDLKKYYFNVSNLPFSADRKIGVRVNEAAQPKHVASKVESDDDVDDTLIRIARFGY